MGKDSHIEWTNHTWNPWMGCKKVSPGCKNCYMYRDMERFGRDPFTVQRAKDVTFNAPLKWKEGMVFTCSWSDFFIEEADEWRADAWDVIKATPHLTYQILTKRPENIRLRLPDDWKKGYPNVWLGVSVENRDYIGRITILTEFPARVHFISYEPALGAISDLFKYAPYHQHIEWLISGGESGKNHRPAEVDWFRSIQRQCEQLGIAYFHKQNGGSRKIDGAWGGREIDGKTYSEYPRGNE